MKAGVLLGNTRTLGPPPVIPTPPGRTRQTARQADGSPAQAGPWALLECRRSPGEAASPSAGAALSALGASRSHACHSAGAIPGPESRAEHYVRPSPCRKPWHKAPGNFSKGLEKCPPNLYVIFAIKLTKIDDINISGAGEDNNILAPGGSWTPPLCKTNPHSIHTMDGGFFWNWQGIHSNVQGESGRV